MKAVFRTLRNLMPLLPSGARRFMVVYIVASSLLAILDIAALMLLAVAFGAMVQESAITLLVVVCSLIVAKSALSTWLQWAATRRFASYELEIGDSLFNVYIRAPWTERL